jgi:hypothetical protein
MLNIIDEKSEIEDILMVLDNYIPEDFGYDTDNSFMFSVDDICEELPNDVEGMTGASKLAIVPDSGNSLNVVVKVPFNGCYVVDEESVDDWEDMDNIQENTYFKEYEGAGYGCSWDYCHAELKIFEEAVEDGFGDFFAAIEHYSDTRFGHPVYIQEKVRTFDEFVWGNEDEEPSNASLAKARDQWALGINTVWLAFAYDYYGEQKVNAFIEYAEDIQLSDLHDQNIGFSVADGRPVILDYSGFFS